MINTTHLTLSYNCEKYFNVRWEVFERQVKSILTSAEWYLNVSWGLTLNYNSPDVKLLPT
jgi:hypothetical protein